MMYLMHCRADSFSVRRPAMTAAVNGVEGICQDASGATRVKAGRDVSCLDASAHYLHRDVVRICQLGDGRRSLGRQ